MSWRRTDSGKMWMRKCAIGVLKNFSSIDMVNSKLIFRGIPFSSSYLGDKYILWFFESEVDCVGFVNNKFFWEDSFSSMSLCSESIRA